MTRIATVLWVAVWIAAFMCAGAVTGTYLRELNELRTELRNEVFRRRQAEFNVSFLRRQVEQEKARADRAVLPNLSTSEVVVR